MKCPHNFGIGSVQKTYSGRIFTPTPKKYGVGKNLKFTLTYRIQLSVGSM